jgi:hypothetical protein
MELPVIISAIFTTAIFAAAGYAWRKKIKNLIQGKTALRGLGKFWLFALLVWTLWLVIMGLITAALKSFL